MHYLLGYYKIDRTSLMLRIPAGISALDRWFFDYELFLKSML